jgi:hypothetical protein
MGVSVGKIADRKPVCCVLNCRLPLNANPVGEENSPEELSENAAAAMGRNPIGSSGSSSSAKPRANHHVFSVPNVAKSVSWYASLVKVKRASMLMRPNGSELSPAVPKYLNEVEPLGNADLRGRDHEWLVLKVVCKQPSIAAELIASGASVSVPELSTSFCNWLSSS